MGSESFSEEESMHEDSEGYEFDEGSASMADEDFEFDEAATASPVIRRSKFDILDRRQLEERQQKTVQETADLLCISNNEAARVLRFYKWDAAKLQDEWFSDPDAVRAKVGVVEEQPSTRRKHETCAICLEVHPVADMAAAACKHYFCRSCWAGYANTAVGAGPSCLDLRCPLPECSAVAPTGLVSSSLDEPYLRRYRSFALRSFVDDNKLLAWCTAPDCENAAEALVEAPREALDVICTCGNAYCFNCKEEAHRPVDCDTVRKWMVKNSAESENLNWILANTKPCPKCTRPIEKNQGCMHMTCSQCRHEFCWLCQGSWAEHGERTGGYYACNTFKKQQEKGEVDDAEDQRRRARQSLERYMHYWQRWAEHDKARKTALRQLAYWEGEQLESLSARTSTPTSQLRFVLDAWKEVVNCRRVLKWTYAVGYYSFDEPHATASREEKEVAAAHKQFFEFTQQDAENSLEKMNHRLEKKLPQFARDEAGPVDEAEWGQFRQELIGLTDVTRTQFAKLVDFLEKGMDEGLAEFTRVPDGGGRGGDEAGPSGSGGAAAAAASAAGPGPSARQTRWSKRQRSGKAAASESDPMEVMAGHWVCAGCTFANEDLGARQCEMCSRPRREAQNPSGG